ncbi:hypothetical protein [Bacillus sp. S1-R4H1-FB]|nr:hypothetical protein [Bacillus sp. S1-R4H1-FB]
MLYTHKTLPTKRVGWTYKDGRSLNTEYEVKEYDAALLTIGNEPAV